MEASLQAYDDAKSKVSEVSTELEEIETKIDELNAKGGLSFIEESELEKLREAREVLELDLAIAEKDAQRKAKEAADSAIDAFQKNFKFDISADRANDAES